MPAPRRIPTAEAHVLPRLMRRPVAASYLGVSPSTLDELGIPARKIKDTRITLYDRFDLDRFADSLSDGDADNPWDEDF